MSKTDWQLRKRPTGIPGLDQLTHGGLPHGQTTLILGHTGTGKTVLGLQILATAVAEGGGGVLVTFEESPEQLKRNADSFQWGRGLIDSSDWAMIDARNPLSAEIAGDFDIDALLAAIGAQAERFDKPWVIIDGIDQLLQHQPDATTAVNQVRQINECCEAQGWTVLLSGKTGDSGLAPRHLDGIEFLLPTVLLMTATMSDHRMIRQMRVAKYRGSSHVTDRVPLIMNDAGIQLPCRVTPAGDAVEGSLERVSTGVKRLDELLGGGPYRGSSTLISGRPGTAKSTLAAGFAEAAAERGERALYISFDEVQSPYVRNLASVGIDLQPHIDAGRIRFDARSAWSGLVSEHLLAIARLIEEFSPHFLIIDPVSALLKAAGDDDPRVEIERFLELVRARNITTILTSLTGDGDREGESTLVHVSTIADTWIVLDYNVRGGERNRSLSIVKSRGTAHSNQQRELLLAGHGLDLAKVYEFGTEVLMGTARAQKESEEHSAARRAALERVQHRQELERRIEQAGREMERLKSELSVHDQASEQLAEQDRRYTHQMRKRRDPSRAGEEKEVD